MSASPTTGPATTGPNPTTDAEGAGAVLAPLVHDEAPVVAVGPVAAAPGKFTFDGGAGSYFGVGLLGALLCLVTLGIAAPWAICMTYRWRTQHTLIDGRRLKFTGTGAGLFGNWIKWLALSIVTLGVYMLWVIPRLTKWTTEHQTFA